MNMPSLDIACGHCNSDGCASCDFVGYLVIDERAEALLAFLRRHLPAATCPIPGQQVRINEAARHDVGSHAIVEEVEGPSAEGRYLCRLRLEDGRMIPLGSHQVTSTPSLANGAS